MASALYLKHDLVGVVETSLVAMREHVFDHEGVGLVTNFEDIFCFDQTETFFSRLEVVQCLSHVALKIMTVHIEILIDSWRLSVSQLSRGFIGYNGRV